MRPHGARMPVCHLAVDRGPEPGQRVQRRVGSHRRLRALDHPGRSDLPVHGLGQRPALAQQRLHPLGVVENVRDHGACAVEWLRWHKRHGLELLFFLVPVVSRREVLRGVFRLLEVHVRRVHSQWAPNQVFQNMAKPFSRGALNDVAKDSKHQVAVVKLDARLEVQREVPHVSDGVPDNVLRIVCVKGHASVMTRKSRPVTRSIFKGDVVRRPGVLQDKVVPDDVGDGCPPPTGQGRMVLRVNELRKRGSCMGLGRGPDVPERLRRGWHIRQCREAISLEDSQLVYVYCVTWPGTDLGKHIIAINNGDGNPSAMPFIQRVLCQLGKLVREGVLGRRSSVPARTNRLLLGCVNANALKT